jgi:hypothetical protein
MPQGETLNIWSKVDYDLVPPPEPASSSEPESPWAKRRQRFWFAALDIIATVFWVYAVLKVFVANVDQSLFGSLAQYRFFFFAGVAALIALKVRNVWTVLAIYGYILGFPLVVVCWKLPRALYNSGSGVVFLACANLVLSAITSLRRSVVEFAVFVLAALATVLGRSPAIAGIAAVCLAVVLVDGLYRTIRNSVLPARFVRMQRATIRKVVRSKVLGVMLAPKPALLSADIERFDAVQQKAFAHGLWSAVLINRGVALWASELEQYRRSRVTVFLNAASYLWLLARSVALLALMNWGLHHADSSAFEATHPPSFLRMLRYTVACLLGSHAAGIASASTAAHVVSVGTFVVAVAILVGLMLSIWLSIRATRDESEIEGLVAGVRAESQRIDHNFRSAYGVSANEAIERLDRLREDTLGLLAGLAKRIPTDADPATADEY